MKIQKKMLGWLGGPVGGGQGGCVKRIEVIVKKQEKSRGGRGRWGGVRVDVYKELKLL